MTQRSHVTRGDGRTPVTLHKTLAGMFVLKLVKIPASPAVYRSARAWLQAQLKERTIAAAYTAADGCSRRRARLLRTTGYPSSIGAGALPKSTVEQSGQEDIHESEERYCHAMVSGQLRESSG